MTRLPNSTDFQITIDDIGTFTFGRRRMRDELAIAAEFSRLTEGVETPTPFLANVAGWISVLKVLTVEAPEGWDIDAMDPLDDDTYAKLVKVHVALREKEGSFRSGSKQASEADGQGVSADA
jgi:hypothetical protein